MKKQRKRILCCMMAALCVWAFRAVASAHPSSQEGILTKSYIGYGYDGYYIGGDDVGWSIAENRHTNGTDITFSFSETDPNLTYALKMNVAHGAYMWLDTVVISGKNDGSGTGYIETYYNANDPAVAKVCNYSTDRTTGHFTSWQLLMNRAYTQTNAVLAHEFGHVIGLNDLYSSKSTNKIMYGFTSGTATSPSALDKWGARVITGQHLTHTWHYKYYDTTSTGANRHVKCCTQCNGFAEAIKNCTYNSQNVCTACNVPYGVQPSSVRHEMQ